MNASDITIKHEWIEPYEGHEIVALAFEHGKFDEPYDRILNVETGVTMANEGLFIVAVPGAKSGTAYNNMPLQEVFDYERSLVIDCFGEGYLK